MHSPTPHHAYPARIPSGRRLPAPLKRLLHGLALLTAALATPCTAAPPASLWKSTAATPAAETPSAGQLTLRFNRELLNQLGLRLRQADGSAPDGADLSLSLERAQPLAVQLRGAGLKAWQGGEARSRAGFQLVDARGTVRLDYRSLRLRPLRGGTDIELLDSTGRALLRADSVMATLAPDRAALQVVSMDVHFSAAAAQSLGRPGWAGLSIADAEASLALQAAPAQTASSCAVPNWPGSAGGAYVADLLLDSLRAQMMRCGEPGCSDSACSCDGPGGGDAAVVIAPRAQLSNSADDNGGQPCTPQDPCAADLPWNAKFSAPVPPYGNDQHPLLVWNLYRLDADGGIAQIGRSGVKHAFIALNNNCDCSNSQVLGRGCGDVYASNNNDNSNNLLPRSEILPAPVLWGRCGSLEDDEVTPPNADLGGCDGERDASGNTAWSQRLWTRESQLDPAGHPGARYLFEAWYLVRDDINIYNSMGFIEVSPSWDGMWQLPQAEGSLFRRGAALDAWADPAANGALQHSSSHADVRGQLRLSVRVRALGGGRWRYDYALMNFDFAQAASSGAAPNLRVLQNTGLHGLDLPLPAATALLARRVADGDLIAANDWSGSRAAQQLQWRSGGAASLGWASLMRYTVIADAAPVAASVQTWLDAAAQQPGPLFDSLAPGLPAAEQIFGDGFDLLLQD